MFLNIKIAIYVQGKCTNVVIIINICFILSCTSIPMFKNICFADFLFFFIVFLFLDFFFRTFIWAFQVKCANLFILFINVNIYQKVF